MSGLGSGLRSTVPGMGSGLAQGTTEILRLRPVWQQQIADGSTTLPFDQWAMQPEVQAQYRNAPKPLPR